MAFPNLRDWSKGRNSEVKTKRVLTQHPLSIILEVMIDGLLLR